MVSKEIKEMQSEFREINLLLIRGNFAPVTYVNREGGIVSKSSSIDPMQLLKSARSVEDLRHFKYILSNLQYDQGLQIEVNREGEINFNNIHPVFMPFERPYSKIRERQAYDLRLK
jgi:hypothetical protein